MPKDTPNPDKDLRERGTYARHGGDPTLASYVTSAFFVLAVPVFILVAYWGFWEGFYGEPAIVPVFAGLLVGSIAVAFLLMHVLTGGR